MRREQMLDAVMTDDPWDVIVIGGGATGLGSAVEAASRGYRTLLLEASDFAQGTSSRSTKLIHGGVRYLRSGQIRMVREALHERGRLLQNAPHIVHPLHFVIPTFQPGLRWYYYAGMKLYDQLAGRLAVGSTQLLSKRQTVDLLPSLKQQDLRGGVRFTDAQFDDARLAIALAATLADLGGTPVNYARVIALKLSGRTKQVVFVDQETGQELSVTGRAVINATGVFSDQVMKLDDTLDAQTAPPIVASQGTHLVLDHSFLPSRDALLIPETDDGRVLFAIPWHDRLLLGTTDEMVPNVSLEPNPMEQEIDYLLSHAERYLQRAPRRSDVLSMFAGLRPLVGRGAGISSAKLSREHDIYVSEGGLVSIIGGKWTTYRKMGEDVVNLAARISELPQRPSSTRQLKLWGGAASAMSYSDPGPPRDEGQRILSYDLARLTNENPELAEPLHPKLPYTKADVVRSVQEEMARTVEDVLSRRTRALLLDARAAIESSSEVAKLMSAWLSRDETWCAKQVAEFQATASGYLPGPHEPDSRGPTRDPPLT